MGTIETEDLVGAAVDGVVRFQLTSAGEVEPDSEQRLPRRHVGGVDRHDHAGRRRVRPPDPVAERSDHAAPDASTDQCWVADQIVDRDRAGRHLDVWRQVVDVRRVVGVRRVLDQPDGRTVEQGEVVLVRLRPVDRRAEVAFHRFRCELVVPPPGHMRFAQPAGQQCEVGTGHAPERKAVHRAHAIPAVEAVDGTVRERRGLR